MQNAGQYGPGAVSTHQSQFVPTESSLNGGSITSSLRQFRKKDVVDKSSQKSEAHVARVAPQNHYPPMSSDCFRYQPFSDYTVPNKYADIPETLQQPSPISTSVIQKAKSMDICSVQPQHIKSTYPDHLNSHSQQYSPDNGQYHSIPHHPAKDPTQLHMAGFKSESHYYQKDQHHLQYQQLPSPASMQPKFNSIMTAQNMRKFNSPIPGDSNTFLNKLSKIHPSMARSIIAEQESAMNYPSTMDHQRGMYAQQNSRYYPGPMYQSNHYIPNGNYPINNIPPAHYTNYPSPCNYSRPPSHQQPPGPPMSAAARLHSVVERSLSPARRAYADNLHNMQRGMNCHNISPKMSPYNYSPHQYNGPEYAQHYQHRRLPQEVFQSPPAACRAQYLPNHEQIAAQEIREFSGNLASDRIKKFIESWAEEDIASEQPASIENNLSSRDSAMKTTREGEMPTDEVLMISNNNNNNNNNSEMHYLGNEGIPLVTAENGGIQLSSEQYQLLVKNGVIEGNGFVRLMEANGNQERVVNLHITESSSTSSDCMLSNNTKNQIRSNEMSIIETNLSKSDDDCNNKRVVIHQNSVINPPVSESNDLIQKRNNSVNQQNVEQVITLNQSNNVNNSNATKELVDKNCSPINLEQFETNLDFNESYREEKNNDKNETASEASIKEPKMSVNQFLRDLEENCIDDLDKSPKSKSMPLIMDFFADNSLDCTKRKENDDSNLLMEESEHFAADLQAKEVDLSIKKDEHRQETCIKNLSFQESSLDIPEITAEALDMSGFSKKDQPEIHSDENKPNSETKLSEADEIQSVMESMGIEIKGETDQRDSSTATCIPPVDGRKKRIFSVDDIIYNIGPNNVRQERQKPCTAEDLLRFVEEEVCDSSLNQMLVIDERMRLLTKTDLDSAEAQEKITNESKEIAAEEQRMEEATHESQVDSNKLPAPEANITPESTEPIKESVDIDPINEKQPEIVQMQEPTIGDESSEHLHYRNAIRVEENSLLLEIAGELLEINVNNINGKKVITVVSLSNTTVLDVNDNNYEMTNKDKDGVEGSDIFTSKEDDTPSEQAQVNKTQSFDFETEQRELYFDNEDCDLFQHEDVVEYNENFDMETDNQFPEHLVENSIDKALNQQIIDEKNDDTISDSDSVFLRQNEISLPHNNMDNSNSASFDINADDELKSNVDVFEYPCIEDGEILVSDEIILTDPLGDNIGLIEEVDRCAEYGKDKTGIVYGSDHVVTTSEMDKPVLDQQEVEKKLETSNPNHSQDVAANDSKELRTVRPEIVILSPTSTNVEDTNCSEIKNVYSPAIHDVAVTTKAARKSYEDELQIHAVTTSGDIEDEQIDEVKMLNYQNVDSVTSSDKEEKSKEITSSGKHIDENVKSKKRKHHKHEHHRSIQSKDEAKLKRKLSDTKKEQTIKEPDEEFVSFAELVKARNLKKLRKMQRKNDNDKIIEEKIMEVKNKEEKSKQEKIKEEKIKPDKIRKEKSQKIPKLKIQTGKELITTEHHQSSKQKQSSRHKEKHKSQKSNVKAELTENEGAKQSVPTKTDPEKIVTAAVSPTAPSTVSSDNTAPPQPSVVESDISLASSNQNHSPNPEESQAESPSKTDNSTNRGLKRKISWADYVSRKRISSCDDKVSPATPPTPVPLSSSAILQLETESIEECIEKAIVVEQQLLKTDQKLCDKNIEKQVNKSAHSSEPAAESTWESPRIINNSKQRLIEESSGLICKNNHNNNKNNYRKPVVDVNELIPLKNHPDVKLQEYKETVDLKLSSLNIQIPKCKPVTKLDAPENTVLIKRFLNFDKMTPKEMEKIKQIISYKKYIEQKNAGSGASGRVFKHSSSTSSSSSLSSTYKINNQSRSHSNSSDNVAVDHMMKLHLKKVNGKRKNLDSTVSNYKQLSITNYQHQQQQQSLSSSSNNKDDYSVVNRLGKNGQPKIILKRNKQQDIHISNNNNNNDDGRYQPIVRLQRIDLNTVKEKFNITINQQR